MDQVETRKMDLEYSIVIWVEIKTVELSIKRNSLVFIVMYLKWIVAMGMGQAMMLREVEIANLSYQK